MIKRLEYKASFGYTERNVELSQWNPHHPVSLTIDKFHCGDFVARQGVWVPALNPKSEAEISKEDLAILVEIVTDFFGPPP